MHLRVIARVVLYALIIGVSGTAKGSEKAKQREIAEWRQLTSGTTASPVGLSPTGRSASDDPPAPPQVFLKENHARFYFPSGEKVRVFSATWKVDRVPAPGYKVSGARLRSKGN